MSWCCGLYIKFAEALEEADLPSQADRLFCFLGAPAHRARHSRSARLKAFELTPAPRRIANVLRDTDRIGSFRFGDRLAIGGMTVVV